MGSLCLATSAQQIKPSRNSLMIYTSFPQFTSRQIKGERCNLIPSEKSIQALASFTLVKVNSGSRARKVSIIKIITFKKPNKQQNQQTRQGFRFLYQRRTSSIVTTCPLPKEKSVGPDALGQVLPRTLGSPKLLRSTAPSEACVASHSL